MLPAALRWFSGVLLNIHRTNNFIGTILPPSFVVFVRALYYD